MANENENSNLRKVITKVMTVEKGVNKVFDFFEDIKNMEIGGAIKIVTKGMMAGGRSNTLLQESLR
jgi:hypothetical protein